MKTYPSRLAMIAELPAGSVGAEIGVYRGDYSLQVLQETQVGHLYLVDPWEKQPDYKDTINDEDQEGHMRETLRKVMPYISAKRCTLIRGYSVPVAEKNTLIPPLDFCTIDAYHAYEAALADVTAWSKRMKPDGVMFMHDFFTGPRYGHQGHTWYSGAVQAAHDFGKAEGWEVVSVSNEDLPTAKLVRKK